MTILFELGEVSTCFESKTGFVGVSLLSIFLILGFNFTCIFLGFLRKLRECK